MEILSLSPDVLNCMDHTFPLTRNMYELIIGVLNESIIGYIIVGKSNNDYTIEHFYINESHRGQGFGTKLLLSCLNTYRHIKLFVSTKNHCAIHIYEKNGFKKHISNAKQYLMVK